MKITLYTLSVLLALTAAIVLTGGPVGWILALVCGAVAAACAIRARAMRNY